MNRLVVFDCDGTLVDSQQSICAALAHSFVAHGLPAPAREASLAIIGLSLAEAMRVLHPEGRDEDHQALGTHYRTAFQTMRGAGPIAEPLYDGIAELIAALDDGGWLLGVATGKSDRGLALCLEHHGLHPRFVTLQTADRHPSKPDPAMLAAAIAEAGAAPETTVMIGDTSFDMAMARAAGARAIGVTWGYHPRDALVAAGAHHVVDRAADIIPIVERL